MRAATRRAIPPLVAVSVAAGGCSYRNPTPQDQARATAETFVESCARGDAGRAMDLLSEPLRTAFVRAGPTAEACARFIGIDRRGRSEAALAGALRGTSIGAVALRGGVARVTVQVPLGESPTFELGFSEGEWKVESAPRRA